MYKCGIITVALFFQGLLSFGQPEHGKKMLQIVGNGYYRTTKQSDVNSINLAFGKGWFTSDRILLGFGVQGSYLYSRRPYLISYWPYDSFEYLTQIKENTLGVGLTGFGRYYVPFGKSTVFSELKVGATFTRRHMGIHGMIVTPATSSGMVYSAAVGVGYSYFVTPRLAIEIIPRIGKSIAGDSKKIQVPDWEASFNFGLQIYLSKTPE